jgi:hypothetical protein
MGETLFSIDWTIKHGDSAESGLILNKETRSEAIHAALDRLTKMYPEELKTWIAKQKSESDG